MSPHLPPPTRPLRWTFLLAVLLTLAAPPTQADDELQLLRRTVHIPERGEVTGFTLLSGTNRFRLVPPPRWRASVNPKDNTLVLSPRDFAASLVLRVEALGTNAAPAPDTNAFRARLLAPFSECTLTDEFHAPTGEGEGQGFDFEKPGKGQTKMVLRHVAVVSRDSLVTFTLTATDAQFDSFIFQLGTLMSSFRREQDPAPP